MHFSIRQRVFQSVWRGQNLCPSSKHGLLRTLSGIRRVSHVFSLVDLEDSLLDYEVKDWPELAIAAQESVPLEFDVFNQFLLSVTDLILVLLSRHCPLVVLAAGKVAHFVVKVVIDVLFKTGSILVVCIIGSCTASAAKYCAHNIHSSSLD